MKRQSHKKYHPRIYEEACEWFVEFRIGTPEESLRRAFYSWLQEAPAHMAAYLDVAANWAHAGSLDFAGRFPKPDLVIQALSDPDNLLNHPVLPVVSDRRVRERLTGPMLRPLIAAGITAIVATVVALWLTANPIYSTGIGEQRSILLSDGSTVYLNSRSRIRVHYTGHEREVYLLAGQALFSDVKDPIRPFIVHTGPTQVRAIGTKFDVDRRSMETVITVIEGKVAVSEMGPEGLGSPGAKPAPIRLAAAGLSTIYLSAGEQLAAAPSITPKPTRVNIANTIAWTQRELVFVSTPLQEVAEEFNRYNEPQLVIADPNLERLQIDGVFSSTDPASLENFLRQRFNIRITRSKGEIVISRH